MVVVVVVVVVGVVVVVVVVVVSSNLSNLLDLDAFDVLCLAVGVCQFGYQIRNQH